MTHIILDCDDVLLDWIGSFSRWLGANTSVAIPAEPPSTWSLAEWLGISDDYCRRLVETFNSSGWFGTLDPVPGAREAVRAFADSGAQITVLTSCSNEPAVVNRRRHNLVETFGDCCSHVICLPLGESKARWLKALRQGIWVEDNYKNALLGVEAGHRTFMVRRRHNRDHEPQSHSAITWIDNLRGDIHF